MKRANKIYLCQKGFTLAELTIVMIIFGMIFTTVMLGMKTYMSSRFYDRTVTAVDESQNAINIFVTGMGRYPCPADPRLGPGDAGYGEEDCSYAGLVTVMGRDSTNTNPANEDCAGGDIPVVIGAMPFKTIEELFSNALVSNKYNANYAMDGWGGKLTYAVTRDLTNTDKFDENMGGICVVDESDINILDIPGTAHAVVISHGDNSKGAYSESGAYIEDCVDITNPDDLAALGSSNKSEIENCDHEPDVVAAGFADAKFLKGVRDDDDNLSNDDLLKFMVNQFDELWRSAGSIPFDNGTGDPDDDFRILQFVNANGGNVGIGEDNPEEQLHISGDILASKIHSNALCDISGQNCMPPEVIAGDVADMQCPDGTVVVRIQNNAVECENPFPVTAFAQCPPGEFLRGISNVHGTLCADADGNPTSTVTGGSTGDPAAGIPTIPDPSDPRTGGSTGGGSTGGAIGGGSTGGGSLGGSGGAITPIGGGGR